MKNKVIHGDCLKDGILKSLPDNCIDSVVTDPPYGLTSQSSARRSAFPGHYDGDSFGRGQKQEKAGKGFMGKEWDGTGIAFKVELWREVLRVLKPGGHLLSFGGTRTYHRMACAIEDAGFEIRDQIQWLYGSGFPKSMDVSKAIDKAAGTERKKTGETVRSGCRAARGGGEFVGSIAIEAEKWKEVTEPSTPEAQQWDGWGTALKPANEPIVLARKPLSEPTVAANVLKWGTGAINIAGCRIGIDTIKTHGKRNGTGNSLELSKYTSPENWEGAEHQGRFPANIILDEEAAAALDEQTGSLKSGRMAPGTERQNRRGYAGPMPTETLNETYGDSGGASRFFYVAKASRKERGEFNTHPTVKPITLIKYLCRLITPPGGLILDPFGGSGTMALAAILEGFDYLIIEREVEYVEIINKRIELLTKEKDSKQPSLLEYVQIDSDDDGIFLCPNSR